MSYILGVSAGFHDAGATLVSADGDIVFAGHSERYSKCKHDANLCPDLLDEFCNYDVSTIALYERPWVKQLRSWRAGQGIDWHNITSRQVIKNQFGSWLKHWPSNVRAYNHHLSHAASGFQTSAFDRATVVVIDAIGEFDTVTIWGADYDDNGRARYQKLWGQTYPHSIGLFYSAVTQRIGLRPMDEEYITMGMAAYGRDAWYYQIYNHLIEDTTPTFKQNLHIGLDDSFLKHASDEDLAASAQAVVEDLIQAVMSRAANLGWSENLVYAGGVALNCLANRHLGKYFSNIWIMPNPGDAGGSLGAAALAHGGRLKWNTAYLGHNIPGQYPVNQILDALAMYKIVGVASGRAEFGPRALGNRSLLADPRGSEIKDKVNEIKRRQKFRPFAPVILEEHAHKYFDMPMNWNNSRYMQVVATCRQADQYPAIVHVDGTSRVQTVPNDGSGIRQLLEKWFVITGCPMLLNTSLNVRGEPMVNNRADADRFEIMYGVKVCS